MPNDQDPARAKALATAQEVAQRLQLATRSDLFARRSALVNGRSSPLQDRLAADYLDAVNVAQRQATEGFLPAPAAIIGAGDILIGFQKADGAPIRLSMEELNRHITLYGATGTAKSSWVAFLLAQLPARVKKWLFDPKDDARDIAIANNAFIIDQATRLRVFHPPSFLTLGEFVSHIATTWARTHYGGSTFKGTMHQALRHMYATIEDACPADLKRIVEAMITKVFTYNMKDSLALAAYRLDRFNAIFPGIFTARHGTTIDDVLDQSLYFSVKSLEEGAEWLLLFLLSLLLLRNRARQRRDILDTIVVIDEGLLLWSNQNAGKIDAVPLLAQLHTMVREFGIGMIVTSTSVTLTDNLLRSNAYTQIAMNTTDGIGEISRLFGFTPAQRLYYEFQLTRGEFIIKLGDRWREPILATFPHLPHDKTVTPERWNAAPRGNSPVTVLTRPTAVPTKAEIPATPVSPNAEEPQPRGLRLTRDQDRVFRRICTGGLQPVSVIATELGLHYQVMDRVKAFGMKTGLLVATPVVVRSGRGGRAILLSGTDALYDLLGLPTRTSSRGGGVAHDYYVQQLSTIPNAHAEVALNMPDGSKKFADILFRYDASVHEWLEPFLARSGTTPSGDQPTLTTGALVALEIEVSDFAKTIAHNATNDLAGGADLVLFAVSDRDLKPARELLHNTTDSTVWERLAIIPILHLLDAVREARPTP